MQHKNSKFYRRSNKMTTALLSIPTLLGLTLSGCGSSPMDELMAKYGAFKNGPVGSAAQSWTPPTVGEPQGLATQATIGVTGGVIESSDGRMRIEIPAGALTQETAIQIQPITNVAATRGSFGAAYRLTPENIAFAKPVTILLRYTDGDIAGTDPTRMGLAYQDAAQIWHWAGTPTVDTTAKTVSVQSTHFSDWRTAPDYGFALSPRIATAKTGSTLTFQVEYTLGGSDRPAAFVQSWSADLHAGGTANGGFIGAIDGTRAQYRAPAVPPANNLTIVEADVLIEGKIVTLSAPVHIVDKPSFFGRIDVRGNSTEKDGSTASWSASGTLTFSLTRNDAGGATFTLNNAASNYFFTFYTTKSRDQTCYLNYGNGTKMGSGGITVAKTLNLYNIIANIAETKRDSQCINKEGKKSTNAAAPTTVATTSLGGADPGLLFFGDGKQLNGTSTYRYNESGSSLTATTSWDLQKTE